MGAVKHGMGRDDCGSVLLGQKMLLTEQSDNLSFQRTGTGDINLFRGNCTFVFKMHLNLFSNTVSKKYMLIGRI